MTSLRNTETGYLVQTSQGDWSSPTVVVASGVPATSPDVPAVCPSRSGSRFATFTAQTYRNPGQLPAGGVMVVGASSSGTQIANEIQRSGRPVTLSIGEHIRAPRMYRGRDLEWWMDAAGVLDERYDQIEDITRARRVPSFQLAGTPDRSTLDLNALTAAGVKLVGRLAGITEDGKAQFAGSLRNMCALSDLKMGRLLDLIDEWARANGLDGEVEPPSAAATHQDRGCSAAGSRPQARRYPNDNLGYRLSARLFLAGSTGPRSQGHDRARRRRCEFAGDVPDGHAVPAPQEVCPD